MVPNILWLSHRHLDVSSRYTFLYCGAVSSLVVMYLTSSEDGPVCEYDRHQYMAVSGLRSPYGIRAQNIYLYICNLNTLGPPL